MLENLMVHWYLSGMKNATRPKAEALLSKLDLSLDQATQQRLIEYLAQPDPKMTTALQLYKNHPGDSLSEMLDEKIDAINGEFQIFRQESLESMQETLQKLNEIPKKSRLVKKTIADTKTRIEKNQKESNAYKEEQKTLQMQVPIILEDILNERIEVLKSTGSAWFKEQMNNPKITPTIGYTITMTYLETKKLFIKFISMGRMTVITPNPEDDYKEIVSLTYKIFRDIVRSSYRYNLREIMHNYCAFINNPETYKRIQVCKNRQAGSTNQDKISSDNNTLHISS
jgi:hypothetical protein